MRTHHSIFLAVIVATLAVVLLPYRWVAWAEPALRTLGILICAAGVVAFALVILHQIATSSGPVADELTADHHYTDH